MKQRATVILLLLMTLPLGVWSQYFTETGDTIFVDSSAYYPEPEMRLPPLEVITPPYGFVSSPHFHGYIDTNYASIIQLVSYYNVPAHLFIASIDTTFFNENYLTPIFDLPFTTANGALGHYFKSSFVTVETEYIRYVAIVGDDKHSLLIDAVYPIMVEEVIEFNLIQAILSINLMRETNE